ncbi:MAG: glycosyl transferase [Chromatiales bacterium 21-64-14]|nr:MAG: glycosyl transferase [Chromatiales bacterium 21-64-14]HQU15597.1 glycosyltransferase [Gammaproteobacteria bacterium]
MKIFFTFENPLPSPEADAEVFINTAKALASLSDQPCWLHVPLPRRTNRVGTVVGTGIDVVRALAPTRPAVLRHLCCAMTLACHRAYWQADLVYTRNLWVARWALAFGQRVVFDHYRPWADQIPPLQGWIFRILCHRRLLAHICHSEYTRLSYLRLGVPESRILCVHNGYDPTRLGTPVEASAAKRAIGIPPERISVMYTGRINERKGIEIVIAAARRLPEIIFVLVGSYGNGPIEQSARDVPNVRIFPWQSDTELPKFLYAADILLIPPSAKPLGQFGVTVLPLKTFLYMGTGRPILAGDTPDLKEVLSHGRNAFLCRSDSTESLVAGIQTLAGDSVLRETLAATALRDARGFTWEARAKRVREIIEPRLALARQSHSFRDRVRRSARWFANLVLRRSWILPSDSEPPENKPPAGK